VNDYEAERIAAAINVLRPDWPVRSLVTLLGKDQLKHRPRRDVLIALAWVASETNSHTPARVLEAGPWWKATQAEGATGGNHPHPLRAGDPDECRTHKGQHVNHCSGCAADNLGPRDDDPGPPLPADMDGLTGPEKFRQARAELDLRMALEARPKEDT